MIELIAMFVVYSYLAICYGIAVVTIYKLDEPMRKSLDILQWVVLAIIFALAPITVPAIAFELNKSEN